MTNKELIETFPECERIKREQVSPVMEQVMNEAESYRQVAWMMRNALAEKYWPKPSEFRSEAGQEWYHYFYGDYETRQKDFEKWTDLLEEEYLRRNGERHTLDEACQIAADEWTRMIFGNHVQNNGDQSNAGGMAMVLGTLAKDRAKSGIDGKTIERFRQLCKEYYLGGCIYESEYGKNKETPYCDYHPNAPLADLLLKAGMPKDSVGCICPWKTGIIIDDREHSVIVRGYQTENYL